MRFDEITARMLVKAANIYVSAAYRSKQLPVTVKGRVELLRECADDEVASVLSHPFIERIVSEESPDVVDVYSIRLGNEKYPHMKFTLRRRAEGGYGLAVESHDQHFEVESVDPDAPRAAELKAWNRCLKEEIESRWRDADLPVFEEE